jgi:hypothetical protein
VEIIATAEEIMGQAAQLLDFEVVLFGECLGSKKE